MDKRREAALQICTTLRRAGHRALLAGGCVRDMLLGAEPKDYDVATSATPDETARLFSRVISVGAQFGVQIVVLPEGRFEVTTFRSDGPYLDGRHPSSVNFDDERADAQRRDFTINAMFMDPESWQVVDYVGGQGDLRNRIVRTVGEPEARFQEDYLRLIRAVRFAGRLGFEIEPRTFSAIASMAHLISKTSVERVRDELIKILTEGGGRRAFELMDQTGLLKQVLPEMDEMKGVDQPPEFHPEGDVFTHTLMLIDHLEGASPALALGTLLHDVGKPRTKTVSDRIRFNNHEKLGAEMAREICNRLRLSGDDTERVTWLVEQHMRLSHAPHMRESKLKRFIREPGFHELLELCRIDSLCSHGDLSVIHWLESYIASLPEESVRPTPLLTGDDLIEMGYKPGPLFGEILSAVEDEQLEGRLSIPSDARAYVCHRWPKNG